MPTTWAEMVALSDQIVADGGVPWCIENGFWGNGPGITAVNWLGDILRRTISPAEYEQWLRGELKFDSPQVRQAFDLLADIWFAPGYAFGGRETLNDNTLWQAESWLFAQPPKCWLLKEPSWVVAWDGSTPYTAFKSREYGKDYDFFMLPPLAEGATAPLQLEGHIVAMFDDRPEVRALLQYIASGAAAEAWVKLGAYQDLSPHKDASPTWIVQARDKAMAAAVQQAGDQLFLSPKAVYPIFDREPYVSISAYIDGAIDLDTALKQIDAAWPDMTLAPGSAAIPASQYEATGYANAAGLDAATVVKIEDSAAPETALDDEMVAEIEAMIEEMMAASGTPGYALGIVKDGAIVYTQGFGVERVGSDQPVTVHSVFGTGSTGKTATATAVMQLVEAGEIDLDAPVTDYLPYFELADERYKDITVRHLLTHRSGMPADPADWFPLPVEYDDGALERYVRSMGDLELLFAPDEEWSYSSLGMVLLADIVAKVSGQTFEDYLQANLLDQLGMADTMLIIPEGDQAKLTGNHVRSPDGQVVVSDIFPYRRQFTPTGPLYSSITDMARFAAAHLNRGEFEGTRILLSETYDAMWQPISKMNWELGPILGQTAIDFGIGWMLGDIEGHRIVSHVGSDEGYGAMVLLAPDDNVAVVMNSNYFDDEELNLAPWETQIQIMAMMLDKQE
ncbi:MAG: serine hydrolase [Caldilineaceae bacterium]|nr:serine hydrolase [Caldilineaceae bacterium]